MPQSAAAQTRPPRERSLDPDCAGRSLEPRRQRSVVGGVSSMQSSSEAAAPCHIAVPSKDVRDGIMRRSRRRRGRAESPCTQSAQEAGNTTLLRRVHNPEMPARSDWFLGSSSTARTTQGTGAAMSIAAARREADSGAHGQHAGGRDLSLPARRQCPVHGGDGIAYTRGKEPRKSAAVASGDDGCG